VTGGRRGPADGAHDGSCGRVPVAVPAARVGKPLASVRRRLNGRPGHR
jgi:hypothetical protein